jgi:hypothetical protein
MRNRLIGISTALVLGATLLLGACGDDSGGISTSTTSLGSEVSTDAGDIETDASTDVSSDVSTVESSVAGG